MAEKMVEEELAVVIERERGLGERREKQGTEMETFRKVSHK